MTTRISLFRSSDSHAPFFAVPWRLKVPLKENDLVEALYDAASGTATLG
jgi:hypothetical protein